MLRERLYPWYSQAVAAGAAFLDQVSPRWETKIDLAHLDLSNPHTCICGQVFVDKIRTSLVPGAPLSGFGYALDLIEGMGFDRTASELGFNIGPTGYGSDEEVSFWYAKAPFGDADVHWEVLGTAWITLIKNRFDTGALSG